MKLYSKAFRFTFQDVARVVGKSAGAVKNDKWRQKFDPSDLLSLCRYVMEERKRRGLED